MKKSNKALSILFVSIVSIITFLVCFFCFLQTKITHVPITTFQLYQLAISSISALLTFCAVSVALFKDSFITFFKNSDLRISQKDTDFLSEVLQKNESQDSDADTSVHKTESAEAYETCLIVHNHGNSHAEDCLLQIHEISFKGEDAKVKQQIDVSNGAPIPWRQSNNSQIEKTTIHQNHRVVIPVLSVKMHETQKVGGAQSKLPHLYIGNINASEKYRNGDWTVVFVLCSKNCSIIHYKLQIKWDGKWKTRLTDIKPTLIISKL